MSISESQKMADYKYKKSNIKRIPLDVPVGFYDLIKLYCDRNNYTVNGFIKSVIAEKIGKELNNTSI